MSNNQTYYDILCINNNATIEEIKKSYKKLALKTHPDKNNGNDEEFKKINLAYETLSDPTLKQNYDLQFNPNPFNMFPFPPPFNMFPFQPPPQNFQPPPFNIFPFQGQHFPQQNFSINIDSVRINSTDKCPKCMGNRMVNTVHQQQNIIIQTFSPCDLCKGHGIIINSNT